MEPARKRGRSDMWEHFNLITPDKVGRCAGCLICNVGKVKLHIQQ